MNKRQFNAALNRAIKAFENSNKDGNHYQRVMDDLTMTCTDEQWLIVDDTINMLARGDAYIEYLEKGGSQQREESNHTVEGNPLCPDCGCPMAAISRGFQCEDCTREKLGKEVRRVWIEYCLEIGDYKPSHLATWDKMSEQDKEVDRRIGEAIARMVIKDRIAVID